MAKHLVVVESPAKAKTIAKYLGKDYVVEASIGHVRDLPRNAADVPEKFKGEAWSRLGVNTEQEFKPLYIVPDEKREQIRKLKTLLKGVDDLYLATDEDREGESIAWHLLEVLEPKVPVRRMVFHEITPQAIQKAVASPRELDLPLVDAQETRRILDRLYGYEISPVLWKKVLPSLSAGRVQSVATRLVVDRERTRMKFRSVSYWDLSAKFGTKPAFDARLHTVDGKRIATGQHFDDQGKVTRDDVRVLDEAAAQALRSGLEKAPFKVAALEEKPFRSSPKAPFMTSTLQQEGGRKLRMSAQQVMRVAQGLYERGYITYMRTDSTNLSETALNAARAQVKSLYGDAFLPKEPRTYSRKVKNAQEAHEAIRPAGDAFRTPEQLSGELAVDELRLYELIWKRTVASQMVDATGQTLTVRAQAKASGGEQCEFTASGRTISFPGYLRAYVEGADDPDAELDDKEAPLPALTVGQALPAPELGAESHATSPIARFTEASLVKRLEELGVGRPSTYASILTTVQNRGYVWKKGTALVPTWTAFAVVNLLERHFPALVDYAFTAKVEDALDDIASQTQARVPWLREFYFGATGLKAQVSDHLDDIDASEINSIPLGNGPDGIPIVVKPGRYGPYLRHGEATCSIPEDVVPDELTIERALGMLAAPKGTESIGKDPVSGLPVFVKGGRFGPYVQLGDAETLPKDERPKTASLFRTMKPEAVTLEMALQLLTIPRVIGTDPADGEEVVLHNGKFGPYVKKGAESRNLGWENEEKLLTMQLPEALEILKQPKQFRGRGAPKPPLKELGPDPVSQKPILAKEGRFGIYVTDGETNASLRKGDSLESLTPERAHELLADRRSAEPRPKRGKPVRAAPKARATKKKDASDTEDKTKARSAKKPRAKKASATEEAKTPASAKRPVRRIAAKDASRDAEPS